MERSPNRPPERVADYPRPPRLEQAGRHVRVEFGGIVVAETDRAWRVKETTHPPTYYLPQDAFAPGVLVPSARSSFCEWKGNARYWTLRANGREARDVGWGYPDPTPGFLPIRDHVALYAGPMDGVWLDGERVTPQPGGFYGGWITAELVGPFKGGPGTMGW